VCLPIHQGKKKPSLLSFRSMELLYFQFQSIEYNLPENQ
jgi:hypothetical protein